MNKRHNKFTLVELLVVICIASLLLGLVLPAFNRMVTGSAVDRLASNLKVRIERARSQAATSNRHVALLLPHGSNTTWSDPAAQAARLGGSRMCFVNYSDYSGTFENWVQDDEWTPREHNALLVRAYDSNSALTSGSVQATATADGAQSSLIATVGTVAPSEKPLKDITDGPSGASWLNSALIFSPKGKLCSARDVYLVVAEARLENNALFYPGGNGSGSYNWVALKINHFTGKVEYYRP